MIAFMDVNAARLSDRDYFDYMITAVENARRRIWVSMFLFDIRPSRDLRGQVLELADQIIERNRAGVDVRVLLAGHVTTPDIAVSNLATGIYLTERGVSHRRIFTTAESDPRQSSHAKLAILDDEAVLGSQNWTDDAFRLNIEDAVILTGPAVDIFSQEFLNLWSRGRGLPTNVS